APPGAVVGGGTEIDHLRTSIARLASGITPLYWHALSDVAVVLAVMLHQRPGKIHAGKVLNGLLTSRLRQGVGESGTRRPQVTHYHHLTLAVAAKRAVRPEGLVVPGVDAVPAEHIVQILGEGLLDQAVLAVDVGDHYRAICLIALQTASVEAPIGE